MSTISASTTSTTGFKVTSDTTGTLVFQTGASPTTAMSISSSQIISFTNPPTATGAGSVATNTAFGTSALAANTTGDRNFAAGGSALAANTTGAQNAAAGYFALTTQTTGNYNAAFGAYALTSNTTAANNSAFGYTSLYSNTTGANNTGIGFGALFSNTTASYNTAVGYQAGYNSNAAYNTYLGYQAGYQSGATHTAERNTAIGVFAGYSLTTGSNNTFVGSLSAGGGSAGDSITTGSKNTIIGNYGGNQGGLDIRTASNYIVLSDGDGNPRMWANGAGWYMPSGGSLWLNNAGAGVSGGGVNIRQSSNTGRIDQYNDGASGLGCQYFYFGGVEKGSITISSTATAYNTSSDYRLKENIAPMTGALARVVQLKPVTYKWKADGSDGEGFIAHELAEVVPQCVSGEKDAVDADNKPVYQGIDTSFLVATLTAAIQELKAEFDAYKEAHP